jgi:hypothetical protein
MVADALVLIGTAIVVTVILFGIGAYIVSVLRPVAVDLFLGIPQIGTLGCTPPPTSASPPPFVFGSPSHAQLGCVHQYVITAGQIVIAIAAFSGLALMALKGFVMEPVKMQEWIKFFGSALLALVFLTIFHVIHDVAAGGITTTGIIFASIPHWDNSGYAPSPDQMRVFAERSIMVPFDKMRDPFAMRTDILSPVDVDGDGLTDRYDFTLNDPADWLALMSLVFTPDFAQTLAVFTIGNMIGIMTTLIVFIAATIKFLLTGVLAVGFPLLFALSKLPGIGRHFQQWTDAYIGLMIAPILLGLVAMVAPIVAMAELQMLADTGHAGDDTQRYVGFIMFVAMAYLYLAVIIASAKFLGSVISSVSTVVMGAAITGVGSLMTMTRGAGMATIGHFNPHMAQSFGAGFGMASSFGGGPGGFYGGSGNWGFASNGHEASNGAPANKLIEDSANNNSWTGHTESDSSVPPIPEGEEIGREAEENQDGENRREGEKEGGGSPF